MRVRGRKRPLARPYTTPHADEGRTLQGVGNPTPATAPPRVRGADGGRCRIFYTSARRPRACEERTLARGPLLPSVAGGTYLLPSENEPWPPQARYPWETKGGPWPTGGGDVSGDSKGPKWVTEICMVICAISFVVILFAFRGCFTSPAPTPRATTPSKPDYSTSAVVQAREFVKRRLVSPSSARFIEEKWRVEPGVNTFRVYGQVDAANRFGVMIRHNYIVVLQFAGGSEYDINDWRLIEISLTEATR